MTTPTPANPVVASFWDEPTGSWQYVFHDPATMKGAIVDPVRNFDPLSGATATRNAEALLAYVATTGIEVDWILDTHPHADHFSAAPWLAERLGAKAAIGDQVFKVQRLWQKIYHLPDDFPTDGRQWDQLFADGETFQVGTIPVRVMLSAGHTLASVTYIAGDAAFVHDTLMMPDSGTMAADSFDQAEARLTLVLDYRNPDPAGEPIPAPVDHPKLTIAPVLGKRQAAVDLAQSGILPTAPDFSKPTHARFRAKLAQIVALAEAGDLDGLQAFEINPVSSSPKAMARYRDLCVIAITARPQVAA